MFLKQCTLALALVSLAVLSLGAPVRAQSESGDETIRGTIASVDGTTVYVHDERGFVDTVKLHDGTIINPTGITLTSGQSVEIHGRTDGHVFSANEIDTPYQEDAGPPPPDESPAYDDEAAPVYVAPYPYYSYYPAYALAYPAYLSLGFGFGCCFGGAYFGHGWYGPGWYGHGYYGHGYYGHGYYGPGYYGRGYYGRGSYGHTYMSGHTMPGYRSTTGYGYRSSLGSSRASTYGGTYRSAIGGYRSSAGGYHGSSVGSAHASSGGSHGGGHR
jgi:hypothetical protein